MDESNEVKGDCYRKSAMLIALLGIALFILGCIIVGGTIRFY